MKQILLIITILLFICACADEPYKQNPPLPYIPDNTTNNNDNDTTDNDTNENIDNPPVADFDFTASGRTVFLEDKSTDDIAIINYEWLETTPSTYSIVIANTKNPGPYDFYPLDQNGYYGGMRKITLTVEDTLGQKSSVTKEIPSTGLMPSIGYTNIGKNTINFVDNSYDISIGSIKDTPVKWKWDFGDGNISTQQNPTHTYSNSGTYQIYFTIYAENGANKTFTTYIDVK